MTIDLSEPILGQFTRRDFACPCCGKSDVEPTLLAALEKTLPRFAGAKVEIVLGVTCWAYAAREGHSKSSPFKRGRAVRIRVEGWTAREVYRQAFANYSWRGVGVDDEQNFVQLEVMRDIFGRWCYRDGKQVVWYE